MILKKIYKNINIKNILFITGGCRGLGKNISVNLFRIFYLIIATSSVKNNIIKFNFYLRKNNILNILVFKLNLKNVFEIKTCVKYIKKKIGNPFVIINNAGIKSDSILLKMNCNSWHDVINVNLNSIYYIVNLFLKKMISSNFGRIINISSIVSDLGNFGQTNYSASKSGIIGFSKSLAMELKDFKITVNVISPGFMKTGMTKIDHPDFFLRTSNFLKMKNIVYLIKLLISKNSNYITGQVFNLNKYINK